MQHRHGRAIILVEGVDKTGKTTEIRRLEERLSQFGPTRVSHFGVPRGNPFELYAQELNDASRFDGSTIIDRLHWSNEAYQTVYRADGPAPMSREQTDELDRLLDAAGGVVVLKIRNAFEAAEARTAEDAYGSSDPLKVAALQDLFFERYHRRVTPGCIVPFGEETPYHFLVSAAAARSMALGHVPQED